MKYFAFSPANALLRRQNIEAIVPVSLSLNIALLWLIRLVITGHSLGGALAMLFAVKFRAKWREACENKLIEVVTFGSPAIGLQEFKNYYGDLVSKTTRIINGSDGVPLHHLFFLSCRH
ncbi:lipase family protein [Pseudoalteromonas xiamenensis]